MLNSAEYTNNLYLVIALTIYARAIPRLEPTIENKNDSIKRFRATLLTGKPNTLNIPKL